MVTFGITTDKESKILEDYMLFLEEKSKDKNMFTNPFKHNIRSWFINQKWIYCIDINPAYPNLSQFFLIIFGLSWLVLGWSNWLLIPLALSLPIIFWTSAYYYLVICLALRIRGFKDKLIYLNSTKLIKIIFFEKIKSEVK